MSFSVKYSVYNKGEAFDELASTTGIPSGLRQLLHNAINDIYGDASLTVDAQGHLDGNGGSCTISIKIDGPAKKDILTREQKIEMRQQGRIMT